MNEKEPYFKSTHRLESDLSESSGTHHIEKIKEQIGGGGGAPGDGTSQDQQNLRLGRSVSVYVPPKVSDYIYEEIEQYMKTTISIPLKERGTLRYMIHQNEISNAQKLLEDNFCNIFENNQFIKVHLFALQFLKLVEGQ